MNNLYLVIIVIIIIFIVFNDNSQETFNNKQKDDNKKTFIIKKKDVPSKKYTRNRPIRENDLETDYYIDRILFEEGSPRCPNPTKSIKEFNKDFFKFRDYTNNNTSITVDPVDKITDLINTNSNEYSDMKIKDLYDHITKGIDLYSKKSVRLPYFDNTMHDNYNYNFLTGMHNVRDNWLYENEKDINGGQFDVDLYGYYPEDIKRLPVLHT